MLVSNSVYALEAEITTAPHVPPYITRIMPETVVVRFEATEFVGALTDGQQYKFWGYNGTVPGPMVRVRLGDTVEFHLSNHPDSEFPHNIDIHAVNGPGGGAVNLVAPGEEGVFRFKTLHPGLYIYHCASPIPGIPAHIANGMYGLFLVEPKHGLSRVDHEFYIFESEFYTQASDDEIVAEPQVEKEQSEPEKKTNKEILEKGAPEAKSVKEDTTANESDKKAGFLDSFMGAFGDAPSDPPRPDSGSARKDGSEIGSAQKDRSLEPSLDIAQEDPPLEPQKNYVLELSYQKGLQEQPDYVVFNGRQGALLGENALKVKVGEKIRIFFGNIGPNGISSFHIIGEIFDQVYLEGAVNGITNRNVQTTLVPSAGATIVELTIDVPGDYLIVDHSIFRMDKGALGLISAVGDDNPEIFESLK